MMFEAEGVGTWNEARRGRKRFRPRPSDGGLVLCAVAEPPGSQHLLQRLRLQKLSSEQRGIPAGHVLCRRAQRTRGVGHAHVGEVGVAELPRSAANQGVARSAPWDDIACIVRSSVGHAELVEDLGFHKSAPALTGYFLDDG